MELFSLVKMLILFGIITVVVIAFAYFLFVRPWILRMGATDDEVRMIMPGDGLVTKVDTEYLQAVTINAPREIVWGYLIQVGFRRAGWYNWDFINRFASKDYFYENGKSADRIIPELQNLIVGDKITFVPAMPAFDVSELKQYEYMLLTGNENGKYLVSWAYSLKQVDKSTTRLCVRWKSNLNNNIMAKIMNLLITEPGGAGIQQSQMLQGIKKRAERDYQLVR